MAVLGEEYYDVTENGGYFTRKANEKRLNRLASLFEHTITPSQLLTLAILITNVSNLGDFINSIRLMERNTHKRPDDKSYRATGLKSPHGRRGSVCAHFGWTLDYLLHGIPWGTVQRMLIDAPGVEDEDTTKGDTEIVLTDDNADEVMKLINKLNR